MSGIGKIPVKVAQGVKGNVEDELITVEGPKGKLTQKYHPVISFEPKDGEIVVSRANE